MIGAVSFSLVLYLVARKDSLYWRRRRAVQMVVDIGEQSSVDPEKALSRLLQAGVTLMQWEDLKIKRLIGRGSFSDVYEAEWRSTAVAVKKLRTDQDAVPEELLSSLITESALIAKLRHPNIVLCANFGHRACDLVANLLASSVMGLTYNPPELALVTEYLDMGSLWQILHPAPSRRRIRVPWTRKIKILKVNTNLKRDSQLFSLTN